jgi:antitoxin (DNA-binding transcriptional repressor) of toxin-antitoxin stability system
MTQATIEQFAKDVNGYLTAAQTERVVVTRNGQPVALVIGMENKDAEDFSYMTSPEFWRMIEETRRMPTVPFEQVKAELLSLEEFTAELEAKERDGRGGPASETPEG